MHVDPAVCSLSADLERDDTRPDQFALPSHYAHGVCDVDRDVGVSLCAAVGEVDGDGRLGVMDRRYSGCCDCNFGAFIYSVSIHIPIPRIYTMIV